MTKGFTQGTEHLNQMTQGFTLRTEHLNQMTERLVKDSTMPPSMRCAYKCNKQPTGEVSR